jgi:predicted DNA-binding protein
MAVVSIRLNTEEARIIDFLSKEYDEDKSTLIKKTILEMYEDYIDKNYIENFEKKEKERKTSYLSPEDILKSL